MKVRLKISKKPHIFHVKPVSLLPAHPCSLRRRISIEIMSSRIWEASAHLFSGARNTRAAIETGTISECKQLLHLRSIMSSIRPLPCVSLPLLGCRSSRLSCDWHSFASTARPWSESYAAKLLKHSMYEFMLHCKIRFTHAFIWLYFLRSLYPIKYEWGWRSISTCNIWASFYSVFVRTTSVSHMWIVIKFMLHFMIHLFLIRINGEVKRKFQPHNNLKCFIFEIEAFLCDKFSVPLNYPHQLQQFHSQ